jgi:hypothetical protein
MALQYFVSRHPSPPHETLTCWSIASREADFARDLLEEFGASAIQKGKKARIAKTATAKVSRLSGNPTRTKSM